MIAPLGVLGGTFDPVHFGHLHVAESVLRICGLSGVLLIPCAHPPHKARTDLTAAVHRLAMLHSAIRGREGLSVSTIELERGGFSYTIDSLRQLRDTPPHRTPVFVLGADAFEEIPQWHRFRELLAEFDLIVVDRPEGRFDPRSLVPLGVGSKITEIDLRSAERGTRPIPALGAGGNIVHLPLPLVAVSATEIRSRAARGESLAGLVPQSVARYIADHRLYQQEDRG